MGWRIGMIKVLMFFVWVSILVIFSGIALLTDMWTTFLVAIPVSLLALTVFFEGDV